MVALGWILSHLSAHARPTWAFGECSRRNCAGADVVAPASLPVLSPVLAHMLCFKPRCLEWSLRLGARHIPAGARRRHNLTTIKGRSGDTKDAEQ